MDANTLSNIKDAFKSYEDFPKEGVRFYDINPILYQPALRASILDHLVARYKGMKIDKIVGLESRGYYYGIPLAFALNLPFIPFRKPGKTPGDIHEVSYGTEYSDDRLCVQEAAIDAGDRILIVDDIIATGGTAAAAVALIHKAGGKVVELHCLVELPALKGVKQLGDTPFYAPVQF